MIDLKLDLDLQLDLDDTVPRLNDCFRKGMGSNKMLWCIKVLGLLGFEARRDPMTVGYESGRAKAEQPSREDRGNLEVYMNFWVEKLEIIRRFQDGRLKAKHVQ